MRYYNLTADGDTEAGKTLGGSEVHIIAAGDFGSGTLTIKTSPDGGTTKMALRDVSGNVAWTDDDMIVASLAGGNTIYLSLASSTSPDIDVYVGAVSGDLSNP